MPRPATELTTLPEDWLQPSALMVVSLYLRFSKAELRGLQGSSRGQDKPLPVPSSLPYFDSHSYVFPGYPAVAMESPVFV